MEDPGCLMLQSWQSYSEPRCQHHQRSERDKSYLSEQKCRSSSFQIYQKKKIRETIPTQLAIPGPCGLHSIGKTASVFGLQAHTMRTFPVEEELGGKSSYFACVSHVRSLGWVLAAGVALRHLAQWSVFLTIRWHHQVVSRLLWRTWESLLRAGSLCLS